MCELGLSSSDYVTTILWESILTSRDTFACNIGGVERFRAVVPENTFERCNSLLAENDSKLTAI